MNRNFEYIKLGCQYIWKHKAISLIPASCLLLWIVGLQAMLDKLVSIP